MRRETLLFSILCLTFTAVKSQYNNDFLYYVNYGRNVSVHGEYDFNSTAIQNSLVNTLILGGHLDSTDRSKALNRMGAVNRAGGSLAFGATAFWGLKNSKYSFITGLKQIELFNSSFSNDLYALSFFGNKMFEGKTANIGGSTVNHFKFQEVKIGMMWDHIDTTARLGFSVSYLNGQNILQVNTGSSSVYTASDASAIYFNMHESLLVSDTSKNKQNFGAMNGNGASAEFFADIPYKSKLGMSKFYAAVNNLGFIRWNMNTFNGNMDTTLIYRGVVSHNIFQLSDSSVKQLTRDTLLRKLVHSTFQRKSVNLPTSFLLMHSIRFSDLFTLNNGFRHVFQGNYKPYIFAEGVFAIGKNLKTTIHIGYGGYGRMTYGLNFEYAINSYYIRLGSNAIQGYISPKNTLGQGLFFSISKKLK